jgi:hypothetical protein
MLFSKNGFKSVDTVDAFIKEAIECDHKDVVLSIVHDNGVIDIVLSPTMDLIEAEIYQFLNDGTELKYSMPTKSLANNNLSTLHLTSQIYSYLSEAFKVADMFRSTTRQSTDYAS